MRVEFGWWWICCDSVVILEGVWEVLVRLYNSVDLEHFFIDPGIRVVHVSDCYTLNTRNNATSKLHTVSLDCVR